MCFKEFYTLTFTNREAYERVLKKLKKHGRHSVSGTFYIIKDYSSEKVKTTRNDFTFEGLLNLVVFGGGYISVDALTFKGWDNKTKFKLGLNDVIKTIGTKKDIFGKVVIELR